MTQSWRNDIPVGCQILSIDDRPMDDVFDDVAPYISASHVENAKAMMCQHAWLLPQDSVLRRGNGQSVRLFPDEGTITPQSPDTQRFRKIGGDIGLVRIPDFETGRGDAVLADKEQLWSCQALIVDLRGNGGGSTPMNLIRTLHPGDIPLWQEVSTLVSGLERAYRKPGTAGWPQAGRMTWPVEATTGDDDAFAGDMIILQDAHTCSAAEDFIMPFKTTGRAHIMGEISAGSTGQPYFERVTNDIWFRVAAKQVFWPDGAPFEGRGIIPDTIMTPTAEDIAAGRDPVLDAAIARLGSQLV